MICRKCHEDKPESAFGSGKGACKSCIARQNKENRQKRYGAGQCASCGQSYFRTTATGRFCSSRCAGSTYRVERKKTHCKRGHDLAETGRIVGAKGALRCWTCHIEREEGRRRAAGKKAIPTRKTGICVNGHPKTPENTRLSSQGRLKCKVCEQLRRQHLRGFDRQYAYAVTLDPCSYCGAESGTIDHIVPKASGGTDEWSNFTGACMDCNRRKSAKPLLAFLCERV